MAGAPLELIAVEVRADLDQLQAQMPAAARIVDQSMDQVGRSLVRAEQQAVRSSAVIGRSFDQASARSRLLGYQISDIGTQLASGASPFLVLAQQAPQVANALEGVGGTAGRLAAFFSGPWGAALLAAASVAGVLIGKLWETEDAADGAAAATNRLADALKNLGTLDFTGQNATDIMEEVQRLNQQALVAERSAKAASAGLGGPAAGRYQQQRAEEARRRANDLLNDLRVRSNPATNPALRIARENDERYNATPERTRRAGKSEAERASERAAREAERERERQAREAAALEARYGKTLAQLTLERQLAELRDRGTDAARQEADIIEANYRIESQFPELAQSTAMGDRLRLQLLQQIAAAAIEEAYGRKAAREEMERWFEETDKRQKDQAKERERLEQESARQQELRIRTLASLYYDAFNGGTAAIWDNFKQIGLAVIAEVLARFTLSKLGGGGEFNLGDALGTAIGAVLPGFATGGSVVIGGRGGTDNNVLALNGRPFARVSAGEQLNIVNPSISGGRGGGTTVISSPQFDLRGAVVTADLYADMERIARANAAEAGALAYGKAMKDAPTAIQRAQRYGR